MSAAPLIDTVLIDARELAARLDEPQLRLGIGDASEVVALTPLGETEVALYDGALQEWAADPALPLVTASGSAPRSRPCEKWGAPMRCLPRCVTFLPISA